MERNRNPSSFIDMNTTSYQSIVVMHPQVFFFYLFVILSSFVIFQLFIFLK
jgi:hypothetical protein